MLKTRLLDIDLNDKVITLAVAAEPEQLIGYLADPDQIPCWADVWPSARALACHIWSSPELTGSAVLELGSRGRLAGGGMRASRSFCDLLRFSAPGPGTL